MASTQEYLAFLMEQLSEVEGITSRRMMGEYILYIQGRIAGYVCDNRLFVKPVPAALAYVPEKTFAPPYEGAREMLLIENVDDRAFLKGLLRAMYAELPPPKPQKTQKQTRE